MSVLEKCIPCSTEPIDWLTALKKCIVKDSDGNYYLNVYYTECPDDCDEITPAPDCVSDFGIEELFKNSLVTDECGNCAISLVGNICEACE